MDDDPETPGPATREYATPAGAVVGRVDGDVVRLVGVPYARAGRFQAPEVVERLADVSGDPAPFRAFVRSPASPQLSSPVLATLLPGVSEGLVASEDCQTLTITIPADLEPGERVPVMVWIHGGAYVTGAADVPLYDAASLVSEQRVIVIGVTYRLGMLGFFGDGDTLPANLGLLDLVAALEFVQRTIASLGGDPACVTLFGQSAGADAISHLMISDGARGLFRRAIVQSDPLGILRRREPMVRAMLAATGVPGPDTDLDELLALQPKAERAALRFGLVGGMPFGVQYGHAPLPRESETDEAWRRIAPEIDLLIGTLREETAMYLPLIPPLRVLTGLPVVGPGLRWLITRPTTDRVYTRDAKRFADRHRRAGGRATRYEIRWAPRGSAFGPGHVADLPLLLGTEAAWTRTALVGEGDWPEVERRGRELRRAWAGFARTGRVPATALPPHEVAFHRD
ncbi:carboxylesterase family protein [Frondihabitans peucedani]|uniref:Carboxylesterase family protein n=1 Tax=Frondihabitans peucedani TaxID=598626 RepID=A0ABP8E158_9MICO